MNNEIPKAVIKEAQNLIDIYGQNLYFLGECDGSDFYLFQFPDDSLTGFPFIYIYDRNNDDAMCITGYDALDIISEFKNRL